MGVFYVLKIVQMVPNSAKHHNYAVLWTLAKLTGFFPLHFPCVPCYRVDFLRQFGTFVWAVAKWFEWTKLLLLKNIFRKRKKPIVTWPWPTSTKIFLNRRLIQFCFQVSQIFLKAFIMTIQEFLRLGKIRGLFRNVPALSNFFCKNE